MTKWLLAALLLHPIMLPITVFCCNLTCKTNCIKAKQALSRNIIVMLIICAANITEAGFWQPHRLCMPWFFGSFFASKCHKNNFIPQKILYFSDPVNAARWILHICAIIYVTPFFTGYALHWQFEAGTVAISFAWFNILLFLRKLVGSFIKILSSHIL